MNVGCPYVDQITILRVCLTSNPDAGKYIHNEYRYTDGDYVSPLQSNLITFGSSAQSPVVSGYDDVTGAPGTGGFPPAGATMEIISNKINFDNFIFNSSTNKFRYLRTNTLYANTPVDIAAMLAASTQATPITGSAPTYMSSFTVPTVGQYLYLIWDYRNSLPLSLCYSEIDGSDACCGCLPPYVVLCYAATNASDSCCDCPTSQGYYLGGGNTLASAVSIYTDAGLTTQAPNGYYSQGGLVRQQIAGVLQAQQSCPGCGTEISLCYSNVDAFDACCGCLL